VQAGNRIASKYRSRRLRDLFGRRPVAGARGGGAARRLGIGAPEKSMARPGQEAGRWSAKLRTTRWNSLDTSVRAQVNLLE
jgi:hypothetical protein